LALRSWQRAPVDPGPGGPEASSSKRSSSRSSSNHNVHDTKHTAGPGLADSPSLESGLHLHSCCAPSTMTASAPKLLWKHRDPTSTRISQFKRQLEVKYRVNLHDYEDLRKWSVSHINQFWEEVWYFTGVKASKTFTRVPSTTSTIVTPVDGEPRPSTITRLSSHDHYSFKR